jgi:hypothetical protein
VNQTTGRAQQVTRKPKLAAVISGCRCHGNGGPAVTTRHVQGMNGILRSICSHGIRRRSEQQNCSLCRRLHHQLAVALHRRQIPIISSNSSTLRPQVPRSNVLQYWACWVALRSCSREPAVMSCVNGAVPSYSNSSFGLRWPFSSPSTSPRSQPSNSRPPAQTRLGLYTSERLKCPTNRIL